MDKGPPERWRRLKERVREKAKTTYFWLVLLALLALLMLLWVAFGSHNNCSCHYVCWLLGVTEKAVALKTLGFVIAGIAAFWGVMAADRRSDAMVDAAKAANNTADAANNTAKATEAGNRQRAFKDGVEHLGSKKPSVRQGGAHALFHLALEDGKLRASIAGVLCAHIRETTGDEDYQEKNKDKPSIEMQSLLRLLFTTETVGEGSLERFWEGITPDLSGGYFCGVELESARFRWARLGLARFKGARLTGARFQEAVLDGAQFQRAWLRGAQFQGAWMRETRFHAAYLGDAQFQGADLGWSQFQGARLSRSNFRGAWLYMAGFQQMRIGAGYGDLDAQNNGAILGKLEKRLGKCKFHGISSEFPDAKRSFEQRIKDGIGEEPDFPGVIFSGGVKQELLAEVREALEVPVKWESWFVDTYDDPAAKKELIRGLESEIGQPEGHKPPEWVIADRYGREDAEQWIREFREAMATVPETNQAT